jgi:competence protein ComEC
VALAHFFAHARGAAFTIPRAPTIALAIFYVGIVFTCLWRGKLRWIGVPMAAAVALWPRPAPPVAWIAADGNDAAIVVQGQEVALKPDKRAYATQLWAQRRGFPLPADATAAQQATFSCDRKQCADGRDRARAGGLVEHAGAEAGTNRSALRRRANSGHASGDRSAASLRPRADPRAAGLCRRRRGRDLPGPRGWRVSWAQPIRGQRPWTIIQ